MVRSSNVTNVESIQDDGVMVVLFSGATLGSNWKAWTVGGFPHDPLGSFYQPVIVDPTDNTYLIDSAGTFDITDVRAIGIAYGGIGTNALIASQIRIIDDFAVDGGESASVFDPISFMTDMCFWQGRASMIRQATAQYRVFTPITIGSSSNDTFASASAFSLEFPATSNFA